MRFKRISVDFATWAWIKCDLSIYVISSSAQWLAVYSYSDFCNCVYRKNSKYLLPCPLEKYILESCNLNALITHVMMYAWNVYLQRSNGASLICLHEQNDRNGDKYYNYVLYGLLAWTNESTNGDHAVSPHLFTNIYNYRYWLEKRLKIHRWETDDDAQLHSTTQIRYKLFTVRKYKTNVEWLQICDQIQKKKTMLIQF